MAIGLGLKSQCDVEGDSIIMSQPVLTPHGVNAEAEPAAVWRVCEVINATVGPCKRCPAKYMHDGEAYFRGCYLHAQECINTVETGNPWRKTGDVRAPFVALSASTASPARANLHRLDALKTQSPVSPE
jgi:hypothetical protein